jgi:hypothetical protein
MATIPDVRGIQRPVTSGEQSVARVGNAGAIGQGMRTVGQGITQLVDANTKYQASRANNAILISKTELDNDDYEGVDYGDIPKQYEEKFKASREEISKGMSNPFARRAFNERADQLQADGMAGASGVARNRELDVERANIQGDLLKLREAGLNGDLIGTSTAVQDTLDVAVEKGYYTAEQAGKVAESWKNDAAAGKLKMMAPQDRIAALKQPWAKNLPSDVKAELTRQGEAELIKQNATTLAESYIQNGKSRSDALTAIDSIDDIKQREEARNTANTMYDRNERNQDEATNQSYEDFAAAIDVDQASYEDIARDNESAIRGMTPGQRANLQKISDTRFSPRANSDPDMLIELSAAATSGDWNEYNRLIKDESSRLSSGDRVTYTTKGFQAQLAPAAKSGITDVQAVAGSIAQASITDKTAQSNIILEVGRWRIRETERTGKPPSDTDRDKYIDSLLIKRDAGFWSAETTAFNVDETGRVANIQRDEPDMFDTLTAYFANRGINPTDKQFLDMYARSR